MIQGRPQSLLTVMVKYLTEGMAAMRQPKGLFDQIDGLLVRMIPPLDRLATGQVLIRDISLPGDRLQFETSKLLRLEFVGLEAIELPESDLENFAKLVAVQIHNFETRCNTPWYQTKGDICAGTSLGNHRGTIRNVTIAIEHGKANFRSIVQRLKNIADTINLTSQKLERMSPLGGIQWTTSKMLAYWDTIVKTCDEFSKKCIGWGTEYSAKQAKIWQAHSV